jgi:hypothetical protein
MFLRCYRPAPQLRHTNVTSVCPFVVLHILVCSLLFFSVTLFCCSVLFCSALLFCSVLLFVPFCCSYCSVLFYCSVNLFWYSVLLISAVVLFCFVVLVCCCSIVLLCPNLLFSFVLSCSVHFRYLFNNDFCIVACYIFDNHTLRAFVACGTLIVSAVLRVRIRLFFSSVGEAD